jgi:hypothetical protein
MRALLETSFGATLGPFVLPGRADRPAPVYLLHKGGVFALAAGGKLKDPQRYIEVHFLDLTDEMLEARLNFKAGRQPDYQPTEDTQ